jgi:uncharacterized protein with FMN-binding domain
VRRALTAVVSAAVLALPYAAVADAATKPRPKVRTVRTVTSKTYVGPAYDADRWGTVTVTAIVRRTTVKTGTKKQVTRRLVDVRGAYEVHTDRSQYIMEQAIPMLKQEVLTAQSVNVNMIGNATYTSEAFLQSLQAALAHMV